MLSAFTKWWWFHYILFVERMFNEGQLKQGDSGTPANLLWSVNFFPLSVHIPKIFLLFQFWVIQIPHFMFVETNGLVTWKQYKGEKKFFYLNRLETKHCFKSVRGSLQSQILSRKALNQSGITTVTANPFSVKAIGNISVGSIISGLSSPHQWPPIRPMNFMTEYWKMLCDRENNNVTLTNHKASHLQLHHQTGKCEESLRFIEKDNLVWTTGFLKTT